MNQPQQQKSKKKISISELFAKDNTHSTKDDSPVDDFQVELPSSTVSETRYKHISVFLIR